MKNTFGLYVSIGTLIVSGLACNKLAAVSGVNLFEGDNAVKAASAIKTKVGADKVNVISVELRKDQMVVTIQSPKDPKDIDKYTYKNGSVTGPEPVQVIQLGNLSMTGEKYDTTEIGDIGFTAVPDTIKQAIDASKLENANVDLISMDNEVPDGGTIGKSKLVLKWRLFVESPRGRKDFWADKNGKLNPKAF